MNIKRTLLLGGLASLLLFTGCQDEDFGYSSEQIAYKTNFEKTFGKISPDQVWDFSTYNLNRLGLESGFNSATTRALDADGNYEQIGSDFATTITDVEFEVPSQLRTWIDKHLREEVYNKKVGTTHFTLDMPAEQDLLVIPIYQGQAGLIYNLCVKSEEETPTFEAGYIWQKSQNLWTKNESGGWDAVTGTDFNAHTVGRDVKANAVRLIHGEPAQGTEGEDGYVAAKTGIQGTFSFFLDITNLDKCWFQPWNDGSEGNRFRDTFSSKKTPGSTDGQMVAVSLAGSPETYAAVKNALLQKFDPNGTSGYTFGNFMVLGCEDSNINRNVALIDGNPQLTGTDWDYNDMIFLVVGISRENIAYTKDETIKKRYMIEDLGSTFDFDFNDIVVDVTQNKHTDENGVTTTTQTLSLKHLCGTIPWRIKVGNYTSPIFPGRNENAKEGDPGYDPTGREPYTTWEGTVQTAEGTKTVTGIFNIPIEGWDPDVNNITVTAWPNAAGENVEQGATDWSSEQLTTSLKEVDGTSYSFPANGKVPYIIACDQTQDWQPEMKTLNPSAIVTWKKPGYESITTPSGGSVTPGQQETEDDDTEDGYNSYQVEFPLGDDGKPVTDDNGVMSVEPDVTFDSWTDDIIINPEFLQDIQPGYTIVTTFDIINQNEKHLMYMKVEAPWEKIGDGYNLSDDQTTLTVKVTPENVDMIKTYGIALKGINVHLSLIQIIPGEYTLEGGVLPWKCEEQGHSGGYSLDWGDNKLYFEGSLFTASDIDLQVGDKIVVSRENTGNPLQIVLWNDDNTHLAEGQNSDQLVYTVTAEMLENIRNYGIYIQGGGVKVYEVNVVRPTFYTLTVETPSHGSVVVLPESADHKYEGGATVSLTAIPAAGYHFVKWADGVTTMDRLLTINDNTTVSAPVFAEGENEYLWSGSRTVTNWNVQNLPLAIAGRTLTVGDYLVFEVNEAYKYMQVVFNNDWDHKSDLNQGTTSYKLQLTQDMIDKLATNNVITINSEYITVTAVKYEKAPVAVTSVSLDATSKALKVGEYFTLTATVNPSDAANKSVSWSSNNTSVATVENGVVTAVAVGTATITVTTADGNKTATCVVTVTEADPIAVTSVTLNATTKSLNVGEDFTLTATINPSDASNKSVTWSSDNTDVAIVDANGKVTAVAAGTATITVTTVDGGKTATCEVTVSAVAVTGVSLNKTEETLKKGKSVTLIATINPTNATNKNVTWASSDTDIATVDANGKVTAKAAGNATITVTTEDGGKTATCVVTVEESSETLLWEGSISNTGWSEVVFTQFGYSKAIIEFTGNSTTNVKLVSSWNNVAATFDVSSGTSASASVTNLDAQGGYRLNVPQGVTVTAIYGVE